MTVSKLSGLFVTATDTEVGKTWIATAIIRSLRAAGYRVGVYKPVCSGAIVVSSTELRWDDLDQLSNAFGEDVPLDLICPQRFRAPLAPPMAAHLEGKTVDPNLLVEGLHRWSSLAESVIVEGAGGLLSPVTDHLSVADLAIQIGFPLVIVARCGLGTINHSLLTVEAAKSRKLQIAGIVLNQANPNDDLSLGESNAAEIERRSGVPVLGINPLDSSISLQRGGRPVTIAWESLFY